MYKIDATTSDTIKASLGHRHGLLIIHTAGQWYMMDTRAIGKAKIIADYVGETCWMFDYVPGWKDMMVEFEAVKADLINQVKANYKGF